MPALDASPLGAAAGFLTRLPVGRRSAPADLVRGAPLFPLVGAAIGACVGGAALASAAVLPPLIAGCVAVAVELALTGALHADGLADSADGLAGRDRERSLAIMRDHALGTYGAAALALDLIVKAAALGTLAANEAVLLPAIAAFALSRAVALPLAAALPYARAGEGTGRLLAQRAGGWPAAGGVAIGIGLALAALGLDAVAAVASAIAVAVATGTVAWRRLGGVTGDVLGAAIELAATFVLVVLVALYD